MLDVSKLNKLLVLVQHRWSIRILAELHVREGAKFVTLANRFGLSRSSLSKTLGYLTDQGLVQRNPGYGHPLRPEYLLTSRGLAVGADCTAISRLLRNPNDQDIAYRKWSLPSIAVIGEERLRFNAVRTSLGDPTPRAVTLALKELENHRWVRRNITDNYPPSAAYQLSSRGLKVWSAVRPLC